MALLRRKPELVTSDQAAQAFVVPALEDVSPQYRALLEQRTSLQERSGAAQRRVDTINERIQTGRFISTDELAAKMRVAALIGDTAPDEQTVDRAELKKLTIEINDIAAAIKILEQRISRERQRASGLVCNTVRDSYAGVVREQCVQLVGLLEAMTAYANLTDDLNENDISWTALIPMPLGWIGSPRDGQGRAAHFLREACEHGFFETDKIPHALRVAGVGPGAH
jgi:hypothetical protein